MGKKGLEEKARNQLSEFLWYLAMNVPYAAAREWIIMRPYRFYSRFHNNKDNRVCTPRVYALCFICHTCQLHMPACRDCTIDSSHYEMTYFCRTHGDFTPCCRKRMQVQENLKDYWNQ